MYGSGYSFIVMPITKPDSLRYEIGTYFMETEEQVPGLAAALFS